MTVTVKRICRLQGAVRYSHEGDQCTYIIDVKRLSTIARPQADDCSEITAC